MARASPIAIQKVELCCTGCTNAAERMDARERPRGLNCNDCGSRPAGEVLSCRDNKVPKETLPGRSPRERRAVPCAPRSARGLADSTSLCCGQRAVPTAPRKTAGLILAALRCLASSYGAKPTQPSLLLMYRGLAVCLWCIKSRRKARCRFYCLDFRLSLRCSHVYKSTQ